MALALNQQKLAGKVSDITQRIEHFESELNNAEAQRASIVKRGGIREIFPALTRRIRQHEQEIERLGQDLDDLLSTMNRSHLLIERIKVIQQLPQGDGCPALLADASFGIGEYRKGTRFELIDSVLQASRIYPILHDDAFEQERRSYIDTIMFNNGMKPLTMLDLTESQKKRAADAAGKWLIKKVGAQQTQLLISGTQTLQEIGFDSAEFSEKIEASKAKHFRIGAAQ